MPGLAPPVRSHRGGDGGDRGVLDPPVPNPGDARVRGLSRNARHVKHARGRKSDGQNCQWLQYLYSVGLRASFRPPEAVWDIRTLLRHRDSLVQQAAAHTLHMDKALTRWTSSSTAVPNPGFAHGPGRWVFNSCRLLRPGAQFLKRFGP